MTATEQVVVMKKLKIKFCSKRPDLTNEKLGIKLQNCVADSFDDKGVLLDTTEVRSVRAGTNKRGPSGLVEEQSEKRPKLDRNVRLQCSSILKILMTHPSGWPFIEPVDPVKLDIPDYFSIISDPMDLGTIKSKLDQNLYFNSEEFAADVKLTFSNSMRYNPPSNLVHIMAKDLNNIFNRKWKSVEAKRSSERAELEQGTVLSGRAKKTSNVKQNKKKTLSSGVNLLLKKSMSFDDKQKLKKELMRVSSGKMPPQLCICLQKHGLTFLNGERIELDIDACDDDVLWELEKVVRTSCSVGATEVELSKMTRSCGPKLKKKIHKGTDGNKANSNQPLSPVSVKSGSCDSRACQNSFQHASSHASASDVSYEKSAGRNPTMFCGDVTKVTKNTPVSKASKSDQDSDGAISALDEENTCPSSHFSTSAAGATSEGCNASLFDVQLSPKKALRAAMLKRRFADVILKAQLLDHGDEADPVKLRQERERLERKQREEKARIEAQIKAAEAASRLREEKELKMRREKEREAARIAIEEMKATVKIYENVEILKDIEMLRLCVDTKKPLENLGLFLKKEYAVEDEAVEAASNEDEDGEEGEIFL